MASSPEHRTVQEASDEEDEERDGGEEEEAPSHLPLAPPSELLDMPTTVDPSYIISLIRQLLPSDSRAEKESEMCRVKQSIITDHDFGIKPRAEESLEDLDSRKHLADSSGQDEYHLDDRRSSPLTVDSRKYGEAEKKPRSGISDDGQTKTSEIKDPWEDSGCILWDLSASRTHAEFMVNNFLLDVLLANLHVSKSSRVTEICLGIIGNLACHESLSDAIVSRDGLIETVINQLFLDDSACLSEAFRLLAAGLQGNASTSWAEALLPEQILSRALWIVTNTLNSSLLEKSIELLLAIVDNREVAAILLRPLMDQGLPNVLVTLLVCEISKLRDETKVERSGVLDLILRLVETISAIDGYSRVISSNEELFHLVCGIVKLPDKIEIASSCASAVIIIANILADEQHPLSGLLRDFPFLEGLFDIFPFVSDDSQARDALWCILAGLLVQIQENGIDMMNLDQLAPLVVDKFYLIEDDIEGHRIDSVGDLKSPEAYEKSTAITTTVSSSRF